MKNPPKKMRLRPYLHSPALDRQLMVPGTARRCRAIGICRAPELARASGHSGRCKRGAFTQLHTPPARKLPDERQVRCLSLDRSWLRLQRKGGWAPHEEERGEGLGLGAPLGVQVGELPDVVGHHTTQRHRDVRGAVVLQVLVLCRGPEHSTRKKPKAGPPTRRSTVRFAKSSCTANIF